MSGATLVLRSLRHYWRTHLGVVLGSAVGAAVLVGALAVGDSVRYTLRSFALARLGRVVSAMDTGGRFFREALASELGAAPVLRLRGIAASGDGTARACDVQVLGVDGRFWSLAPGPPAVELGEDQVALNEKLARQLGARPGDQVVLRFQKPSLLSRDAPLSVASDYALALRLDVVAIVGDRSFGRFSLKANQLPPSNAYLALGYLQRKVGLDGKANLALSTAASEEANARVGERWKLADAGLEIRRLDARGCFELRTERIFLEPPVAEAAAAIPGATGVLTYFVNELRVGNRAAPYSMVTAIGRLDGGVLDQPPLPADLGADQVVINEWLADDLGAKPGDELTMAYYVVGPMRRLVERRATFTVRSVVPLTGVAADRSLMPEFPGIAEMENCRDWRPGIPIDLSRIRKKDEAYWDAHRGTPKAFIALGTGRRLWRNRFGDLTAVRWPLKGNSVGSLASALRARLDPAALGLFFRPVRRLALAASGQALDFGQLFIGLSFFLIAAAVLLTALLFVFGVEQRSEEVGTLLALGFTQRRVRRLLVAEGAALALVGSVAGAFAGTTYTRLILHLLATVWHGAIARTVVLYHARWESLGIGGAVAFAAALGAMWVTLRRQLRRSPRDLLSLSEGGEAVVPRAGWPMALWLGVGCVVGAVAIVVAMGPRRDQTAAAGFFGAGALLLVGAILLCREVLGRALRVRREPSRSVAALGWRNAARRRGRSLAVAALLACGSFLVVAVGANRKDPWLAARERSSGTGGFALVARSTIPVFEDLNSARGRETYGLDETAMAGVKVVAMRVHEGDDASCLNLNRAQRPTLLGVSPEALASRRAFAFVKTIERTDHPWLLLAKDFGPGVVPAIGDDATITWGLARKVGDTLDYTDERGRPFKVKLVGVIANSVLQGSLVIAEERFVSLFPSEEGYRFFLIDAPWERADAVGKVLSRALGDAGFEATLAAVRLAEFNTVENTYLSIFQVLGGLGLVLGSVGLAVVVMRNVLERRGELALLRAVGFRRRTIQWMVLSEHWGLLAMGLVCGVVAALVAVLPALRSPGAGVPYGSLALTLGVVVGGGLVWTWLAAGAALSGPLLPALRKE